MPGNDVPGEQCWRQRGPLIRAPRASEGGSRILVRPDRLNATPPPQRTSGSCHIFFLRAFSLAVFGSKERRRCPSSFVSSATLAHKSLFHMLWHPRGGAACLPGPPAPHGSLQRLPGWGLHRHLAPWATARLTSLARTEQCWAPSPSPRSCRWTRLLLCPPKTPSEPTGWGLWLQVMVCPV